MLLHLIDGTQPDPAADYLTIRNELAAYGYGLEDKQEVVAITKTDAMTEEELATKRDALQEVVPGKLMDISAVAGKGVDSVLRDLWQRILEYRAAHAEPTSTADSIAEAPPA